MTAVHEPPRVSPESAVRLWVEAATRHHGLDPLYRRRLRGEVVNRYVAVHEGTLMRDAASSRRMGRVGRATLYASVALALSVGSAMAVSGTSIPGDALYPLKREIEELRAAVLPTQFDDDLAAHVFAQRTYELGRLVEAGDMERAIALLPEVRSSYDRLVSLRPDVLAHDASGGVALGIVDDLIDQLPAPASDAIQRALGNDPGLGGLTPPAPDPAREGPDTSRSNANVPKATPATGPVATPMENGGRGSDDEPRDGGGGRGPEASRSPKPSPSPEALVPDSENDQD